ncbi:uncharacterized protein N7484_004587 [Penicillium longicatenatum]|uniref:uncharacterized protein n=1 Tax=Penicillium longicatenatum TaxID=1561947 RepID=UPI00254959C7|nr:uncharacterized protein N7484_004587 [Penicillium longicatenatum]KAJ5650864.1 hypothetical protein N7484_004587 [Penicillium longicatenatum]
MSSSSVVYDSDTASDERPPSQPTRTKIHANFKVARPPPKSSLRLAPKLLLQIQQVAVNHRPVPVLEIWQPPFRKSKLTREFPQRPKLRSGDIYVTSNEPYMMHTNSIRKDSTNSSESEEDCNTPHRDIIAALCQSSTGETPASSIYFRNARSSWQGSVGTAGSEKTPCYRFTIRNDQEGDQDSGNRGRMILQWEKRSSTGKDNGPDSDQFVLFLIDRTARRKSRLATMTRGGLEILVRKSSIMEHLQICMDLTDPLPATGDASAREALEAWLYTEILTLGVWVAQQEGWHGLAS